MTVVIDTKENAIISEPRPDEQDEVTLGRLASALSDAPLAPDYLHGKTQLRNEVMNVLGASSLAAERAVDRLLAHGWVAYDRTTGRWQVKR
ncbi:MAG: hypothetical protein AAGA56_15440 [Myxococcota bacterium]